MDESAERLTTRAGTALTPDDEAALVAEAEAGFDPAVLVRRPVGRPSLSAAPGRAARLDVRVDDATDAAVRRLAREQNRRVSDVVRDALKAYVVSR